MIAEIRKYTDSFVHLFIPRYCSVCGEPLLDGEELMCTSCRWNMPLTYFWKDHDNPVWGRLSALFELRQASSFFFYTKGSGYDRLIHSFKYNGKYRISYELGYWFGQELKASGLYDDIDVVVPIPLHPIRFMKRGYNQSAHFARGLAHCLGVKVSTSNVIRSRHNRSQTRHSHNERWENVSGIFDVRNPSALEGKHLLIVDDVLTTGATIESCATAILSNVNDCRLSVATIATSSKDLFGKG